MVSDKTIESFVRATHEESVKFGYPLNEVSVWKSRFGEEKATENARFASMQAHRDGYLDRNQDGLVLRITQAGLDLIKDA